MTIEDLFNIIEIKEKEHKTNNEKWCASEIDLFDDVNMGH